MTLFYRKCAIMSQYKVDQTIEKINNFPEVILESDKTLNSPPRNNIHEGQISLTHGFVPYQPISVELPAYYKPWEDLAAQLPSFISEGSERKYINSLPLLKIDEEHLPNEHLSRAIALIGNFAHAYYYNQRLGQTQEQDPLPTSILTAWEELTKRVQRKLPPGTEEGIQAVRIHYDTFLTNWCLNKPLPIDGINNSQINLKDLTLLSPIFGNTAEYHFNMTFVIMELRFAVALKYMSDAINAVANKDDAALLAALNNMTFTVELVTEGLDYINPNPHSSHHVDPSEWTKTVAKIDGRIPGGISGLSGSAMPLFHALDTFIERKDYSSTMGQAMVLKYKHQPTHIQNYLAALRVDLNKFSIRKYIAGSENPLLKSQYDELIQAYLGEEGLMGVHALKVYGYMKLNFRSGRLLTNGGHDGTSTIATEPQRHIYNDFAKADIERYGDYKPKQNYATKISMSMFSDKAANILLDISHTALNFQPGDHCAIRPKNAEKIISNIVKHYNLDIKKSVSLNTIWKEFFQKLDLEVNEIELGIILQYADLSIYSASNTDFLVDKLNPIAPRYYSVSPMIDAPQKIRLLVGVHSNSLGEPVGLASTYLMSAEIKYAIERVPARHFHIPKSKNVPMIGFAAGTGISPLIGMIDARAQQENTKNYLFYSTPNLEAFYYKDELSQFVKEGKLNFSIIFSRGEGYNSGDFTNSGFETTSKYSGKHVDQLINEQNKLLADLILNQNAQIYVCGGPGFADTVRASIISAISTNNNISDPSAYVDTMIADFRFNNDVYASADPDQTYPSFFDSEIATHNKLEDCWGIINGSVYNLTRFVHEHPGGDKIILVNAGLDMSSDYNYIKHNQRAQIEGLLSKYKIGVLALPTLNSLNAIRLHKACKQFLEGITEMENTLRNNTRFPQGRKDAYLWREVYGVFVDGSLASYRKEGSNNAGSLNYVLGPVLKAIFTEAKCSSTLLDEQYEQLMKQATACGEYLRQSTVGPLSIEELDKKKLSFDMIMNQTYEFLAKIKNHSLVMLQEMEKNNDEYREDVIVSHLEQIANELTKYSLLLNHILIHLPKLEKHIPKSGMSMGGCVFAQQLQNESNTKLNHNNKSTQSYSNAKAIGQYGLMPLPKEMSQRASLTNSNTESIYDSLVNFMSKLNPWS